MGFQESKAEPAALPELALDPNPAPVGLDDAFRDREPEPETAPIRLARLPEAIEQMRLRLVRYSRPGIGDLENDFLFRWPGAQHDPTACPRELHGVIQQIAEHLRHP